MVRLDAAAIVATMGSRVTSGAIRSDASPASRTSAVNRWLAFGLVLTVVGVAIRINNAIRFRTGNGFDATQNFEYIRLLMDSWALPDPDAGWSTSHAPLFYYGSALLWRGLAWLDAERLVLQVIPLAVTLAGLAAIGAAVVLVHRIDPGDVRRTVLAAALLLFLPVQLYLSPMLGEELLVVMWSSLALLAAVPLLTPPITGHRSETLSLGRAAWVGLLAGLALLTKLSGVLVLVAIVGACAIGAVRRRAWSPALARCAVVSGVAILVGGWFYLRAWWLFGYLYPQDLSVHAQMFEMPPGSRDLLDYLRFPLATFTDPQLLNPELLHSIWGSTYATVWFDGHRHFLARSDAVTRIGSAIGVLALVPTAAFLAGVARGVRRAIREPGGLDTLLVLMVVATFTGYVAFTWGNPWYVTVKGSYLLVMSVPFAVYASESLSRWTRSSGLRTIGIHSALAALVLLVVVAFTIGPVFSKDDGPGLPWRTGVG